MIAIIGGSGLSELQDFILSGTQSVRSSYSSEPVQLSLGSLKGHEVCFLPRHGSGHTIAPHRINYRANIDALRQLGVEAVIAVNAVGGIDPMMGPGVIAVPDQIIDYTWGREHTFYDAEPALVTHTEFGDPYQQSLRAVLLDSARRSAIEVWPQGVYGCTQGPRLESRAEVQRLRRDGCDMVGMTGMPEAALAREVDLPYACLALSVNWAAGLSEEPITMESIYAVLEEGMGRIHTLLHEALGSWSGRPV